MILTAEGLGAILKIVAALLNWFMDNRKETSEKKKAIIKEMKDALDKGDYNGVFMLHYRIKSHNL